MMNDDTMALSGALRDELSRSNEPNLDGPRIRRVDPRTVPLRFHHMKAMGRCAAHCLESFQSDGESSLSQRLGTGVHAMLLGMPVALWDQPAANGKGGKAPRNGKAWEQFMASHPGAAILNRKEHDRASRIANAIRSCRAAADLLFAPGAKHEDTLLWTQQGRARRSTPDVRGADFVAEVKTTRCASPAVFKYDVRRYAYHAQLMDQAAAVEAVTGKRPTKLIIIAVETTPPFVVQTFRLTPSDEDLGDRLLRSWFEAFRVAEDSDSWGGYHDDTVDLDLPVDDDFELTFGDGPSDDEETES